MIGLPGKHRPTFWEPNDHISASCHCHPPSTVGWPQAPNEKHQSSPGVEEDL